MCGNTVVPFVSAAAEHPDADLFVVEASSFRLMFCRTFHPRVSVITNLAPDHLDWHATLDEYRQAKSLVAARQSRDDLFLYPDAQPELASMAPEGGPSCVPFGVDPIDDGDAAWFESDEIVVRFGDRTVRAGGVAALAARGRHFAADAAAAAAALVFLGSRPDSVERALASFEVAHHRLEPVGTLNGVSVVDDSVSANAHATVAAIRHVSFDRTSQARVVLIAGGRNKGIDLTPLATMAAQIKCVVAIGEASEELATVFADSGVPVKIVGSMNEAVGVALSEARAGDVVLMSPACASFDMFRGYADRGRAFVEACRAHGVKLDAALRLP
jgi:UDP-N-acetylmuramoylalanine--D-glutamate ligase